MTNENSNSPSFIEAAKNNSRDLRIFISYSSKDIQIAEKVERYLQQEREETEATYSTWRDKRSIEADWSNEIADALTKQDVILLLWTKNASESDYVKSEWMTARALGKVIKPVLFSKDFPSLQLPKPLENIQAIADFERVDDAEKNIQKLLYPLRSLSKEKSTLTVKYDYSILPAKHQIPFLPNPDFIGRAEELIQLYLDVIGGLNKLNYAHVGIVGTGGVGKTQLAVEFTYRYAFQFEDGVYWIQGADQSKWLSQIIEIAKDLGLEISKDEEINKEKNYFNAFKDFCKEYGSKVLLIIDNVEDPRSLNDDKILFPSDHNTSIRILELECNILFTTRRDFVLPGTRMHNINLLSPESSLNLLTKYRKSTAQYQRQEIEEMKYAEKLCNSVGYLPLVLVIIQAYLRKYHDVSFKDYYEEFEKNKLSSIDLDEISEDQLSTRHSAAIRVTLDQDWKILEEKSEDQTQIQEKQNAKKLLSLLSLFPESALVPKSRLVIFSGIDRFGKIKLKRPAESALIFLDVLNLIDVLENGKSVRIHPLLKEYVLEKLEGDSANKQAINLKAESILNLKRAYYDNFPSLVQEYVERNNDIDSIREDFETVLLWSKEFALVNSASSVKIAESEINPIYELNKIINQESHNLRLTVTNDSFSINQDKQVLFAQSVLIRSFDLNQMEMASKSREFLIQLEKPFLDIKWARIRSKAALIRTLEGHSFDITSVAITSDNSRIVSGSRDKTIKVWDMNSGKLLNTLEDHHFVNSVAITSDNSKIVSGSGDKTIKVWDMNSGKLLKTLKGHSNFVHSIAISSDNSKIVSGGGDYTIKVWDMNTGELLNTLKGDSNSVSVAITSDNSKIVSESFDGTIKFWDMNTGELLKTLEGHSGSISSVAISSDNSKIVSGSRDTTVKVWDMNTGKLLNTLEGHSSDITSVAITSDNSKIVSGGGDYTIKVWDMNTGKLLNTLEGHSSDITSVAITSDNSKIVSGSFDGTIKVWDMNINSGERLKTLEDHSGSITSVAITSDNSKIVSGSFDGTIKVWDMNTGERLKTLKVLDMNTAERLKTSKDWSIRVYFVAITSDNSKIVSGSFDGTIKVWDLNTGELLNTLEDHSGFISSVAITSDNSKIVSRSNDDIKVWDLNSGKLLNTLEGYLVSSVAITSDNNKIVSGSDDKTIKVWDMNTGKLLKTLKGHSNFVTSVAITSDNSKIVSGSGDKTIKVWDMNSGKLLNTLEDHSDSISSVAISSDNSKIVSRSITNDSTIKVWDLLQGKYYLSYKFDASILSVAFSKSKNLIALGDSVGNLYAGTLFI